MNAFPSLYLGFGAIQLFTALSFGLLTRRAALASAQASFGWVALALGMASIAQYFELLATSPHDAARWQSMVLAAHFGSLLAFTPFVRAYFDLDDVSFSVRATCIVAGVTMLPVLAGFAYDPAVMLVEGSRLAAGPERPVAAMTPIGFASAGLGFFGYLVAWAPGLKKLTRVPLVRELAAVMSVTSVAYSLDFVHYAIGVRAIPLAPISVVFFSLALSLLILSKYLEVRSELERQTSELRLRYDQIAFLETEIGKKEPLAIVGELSGVIARQIQTPVTNLREAAADLRIEDLSDAAREHALSLMVRETERLNRLITDLLTYARPIEPQIDVCDVPSIWEKALDALKASLGTRPQVDVSIDDEVRFIDADARLLEKAVLLLLESAASKMSAESHLRVVGTLHRERERDFIRVEIGDSHGWVETMARASLKSSGKRTVLSSELDALTLGIIDKIITAHGGTFHFERRPDGALVGITLFPLRAERAQLLSK